MAQAGLLRYTTAWPCSDAGCPPKAIALSARALHQRPNFLARKGQIRFEEGQKLRTAAFGLKGVTLPLARGWSLGRRHGAPPGPAPLDPNLKASVSVRVSNPELEFQIRDLSFTFQPRDFETRAACVKCKRSHSRDKLHGGCGCVRVISRYRSSSSRPRLQARYRT
eukprot:3941771-Rhodomonas_salina.1